MDHNQSPFVRQCCCPFSYSPFKYIEEKKGERTVQKVTDFTNRFVVLDNLQLYIFGVKTTLAYKIFFIFRRIKLLCIIQLILSRRDGILSFKKLSNCLDRRGKKIFNIDEICIMRIYNVHINLK